MNRMGWFSGLALAGAFLGGSGSGQTAPAAEPRGRFYVEGFAGEAIIAWLGSEDRRKAHGFGVGYYLPAPRRLRYRGFVPELLIQGYHHRSTSPGASGVGPNGTDAYGVMALARYTFARQRGIEWVFDMGTGMQYADMRTVDLSGRLSFTPTFGLGVALGEGRSQLLVGVRYLHISNAGLQGNNQGQNQILLTVGVRF